MGVGINAKNAYMKQKHRMIWERRHGPVGSGMKQQGTKAQQICIGIVDDNLMANAFAYYGSELQVCLMCTDML